MKLELTLQDKILQIGKNAKVSSRDLARLNAKEKNEILFQIKKNLISNCEYILEENKKDMAHGREIGMSQGLLDRLLLNRQRIENMADSLDTIISLNDPVGKTLSAFINSDGLNIAKRTVPMGVIAIIYEARPNVTLDAAALSLKAGSSIILRGGKEAINSNIAIASSIRDAIKSLSYNENMVQIIEDTKRDSALYLMQLKGYVDLLVPRGSASLINSVVENAKVPTLQTGVGNCHVYVDSSAKVDMAIKIIENAKTQRVGVCNAMESLLVHRDVDKKFFAELQKLIDKYSIKVYAGKNSKEYLKNVDDAKEDDYGREYLDMAFSMKIVESLDEAIDHIYKYSTGHSEVIVTESYENAMEFTKRVDSAAVYVNASSRFTDGGVFGFGAELGISTQKLHARGPVGLDELVSSKFVILGNGQVRE